MHTVLAVLCVCCYTTVHVSSLHCTTDLLDVPVVTVVLSALQLLSDERLLEIHLLNKAMLKEQKGGSLVLLVLVWLRLTL